jgi:hypothetical protein
MKIMINGIPQKLAIRLMELLSLDRCSKGCQRDMLEETVAAGCGGIGLGPAPGRRQKAPRRACIGEQR